MSHSDERSRGELYPGTLQGIYLGFFSQCKLLSKGLLLCHKQVKNFILLTKCQSNLKEHIAILGIFRGYVKLGLFGQFFFSSKIFCPKWTDCFFFHDEWASNSIACVKRPLCKPGSALVLEWWLTLRFTPLIRHKSCLCLCTPQGVLCFFGFRFMNQHTRARSHTVSMSSWLWKMSSHTLAVESVAAFLEFAYKTNFCFYECEQYQCQIGQIPPHCLSIYPLV